MSGLVAGATTVLDLAGRVSLALLLSVFLVTYGALGLVLMPLVALALAAIALPRRLRALARLVGRLHRSGLSALRQAVRHGATPSR